MAVSKIRVAFVDDNTLARQALSNRLNISEQIELVGEAADGFQALELARELKPDVFLVDVSMPGMNGIELTRRLTEELPQVGVIILTIKEMLSIDEVFGAGARGFLLKYDLIPELEDALITVAGGEQYLSRRLRNLPPPDVEAPGGLTEAIEALESQDREFLKLMLTGRSVRECSAELDISAARGAVLRKRIMEALGVRSMGTLVRYRVEQRNGISEHLPAYMVD